MSTQLYEITITMQCCPEDNGHPGKWDWTDLICSEPCEEILNVFVKEF